MSGISVSAVFKEQLKSLCLRSFPCGTGSWVINQTCLKGGKYSHCDTQWENENPENENLDSLIDLLNSDYSPWMLEDSCNPEAQLVRQLAVTSPESISDKFIYSYITSLRVVDKEVSDVDKDLLRFQKLEELVLSTNNITTINSSNLPSTLKVLELCSNRISSLKDLAINAPPMMQHLGLAYNRITCTSEQKYLTMAFWPNLVSLDLSFNDLTDVFDLIPKLSTLQRLRILILQGNPLTFISIYRGYTIDSLPALCVLDDIPILPDERHQFSGLANKTDDQGRFAQLLVSIEKLKGIPNPTNPSESQAPEEYPLITYNYYVTYEFIEDQGSKGLGDNQTAVTTQAQQLSEDITRQLPFALETPCHTGFYKTEGKPWLEVIECNYKRMHIVGDLLALKSFLLSGMKITVTEEKTLSWPLEPEQIPNRAVVTKSGKKGGSKDKGRSSSKGSKSGSQKKKKKENLDDLRPDPPIVRTLGSVTVSLEGLVLGEMQVSSVCNFGILCTEKRPPTAWDKNIKKTKDRKVASGRESAETHKPSRSSSAKRKHVIELKPPEELPPSLPVHLTAEIQVQVNHWKAPPED
ncbi:leucine-rich repeat-containing protein 43 [Pelodytes ibericus]